MDIYHIFLIIGVLFSAGMGVYVYWKNEKSATNVVFFILSIIISYCFYINYMICRAENIDEVYHLLNLTSIRCFIFPLTLHLFILLTKNEKLLKSYWIYFLLYTFPTITIFTASSRSLFHVTYLGESLGWNFFLKDSIFGGLLSMWILGLMLFILFFSVFHVIKSRGLIQRKQAWLLLYGFIIALLLPIIFDIIMPTFGIKFPHTASWSFISGYLIIGYAIVRYELFATTPENAAEDILKTITDLVILTNSDGTISFINKAVTEVIKYEKSELIGKNINDLFSENVYDQFEHKHLTGLDVNLYTSENLSIPSIVTSAILWGQRNKITGYAYIIHEVTELHNIINKLKESEIRYRNIFENIPNIYFEIKPNGKIIEVSPSLELFSGYKRNEILGKNPEVFFENKDSLENFYYLIFKQNKVFNFETRLYNKQGKVIHCVINAKIKNKNQSNAKIVGSIASIEELKRAEQMIIDSEKRYRLVTENSYDLVSQHLEDGTLNYISPSFNTLGYKVTDFLGKTFDSIIHPDHINLLNNTFRKSRSNLTTFHIEYLLRNISGQYLWMETHGVWVNDKNFKFLICNTRDITERKKIEAKRKESEEKFRLLFEKSPDGIILLKDMYRTISVNDSLLKIFGYNNWEEYNQTPFIGYVLPEYQTILIEIDQKIKQRVNFKNKLELRITRKDFSIRLLDCQIHEVTINKERFIQIIIRDITEQKEAEIKLIESERKYSLLIESSPDDILLIQKDFTVLLANKHVCEGLGFNKGDIEGKTLYEIFPPNLVKEYSKHINDTFNTGEISELIKIEIPDIKGTKYFNVIFVPIKDTRNNVESIISISKEITEAETAQLAIRENEKKYRIFLENFRGIAFRMDLNYNIEFLYGEIEKITGWSSEDFIMGKIKFYKLIHPEDRDKIFKDIRLLKSIINSRLNHECRIINRNGEIRHIDISMQNLMDIERESPFIHTALFDKTDIINLQEKVINSIIETEDRERMRFAEDLHDDLGPLLSSIRIYINLIQSKSDNQLAERENLIEYTKQLIDDAVRQTRNIAYNILPEILNQYGLIASIRSFCKKLPEKEPLIEIIDYNMNSEERFDSKIELVYYRILKELINNTQKYAKAKNTKIRFSKSENTLTVEYTDDGIGFEFEKCFNQGSSLGLRNIFQRIKTINGKINYETAPGKGVHISISAPLKLNSK